MTCPEIMANSLAATKSRESHTDFSLFCLIFFYFFSRSFDFFLQLLWLLWKRAVRVPRKLVFHVACYFGHAALQTGTNCTLGSCQGVKCPISVGAICAAIIHQGRGETRRDEEGEASEAGGRAGHGTLSLIHLTSVLTAK